MVAVFRWAPPLCTSVCLMCVCHNLNVRHLLPSDFCPPLLYMSVTYYPQMSVPPLLQMSAIFYPQMSVPPVSKNVRHLLPSDVCRPLSLKIK